VSYNGGCRCPQGFAPLQLQEPSVAGQLADLATQVAALQGQVDQGFARSEAKIDAALAELFLRHAVAAAEATRPKKRRK
jgi:hypothetical protein